jgi:16S rRNA (uracil1498-N3)-methyltransferase
MRLARFYVDPPLETGARLSLSERAAHHAARVLRLRAGDRLTLFDGRGGEYAGVIANLARNALTVEIGAWQGIERESPLAVTLAQGISSAERMDLTVQKAVELGVTVIQPLVAEKSVVRLDARRAQSRLAHWRRVAISACEQCGRNRLPQIGAPVSIAELCDATRDAPARWLLAPEAQTRLRDAAHGLGESLVIAAGPEAGFSDAETHALAAAGYARVNLGPRILRTETAALAAIAALNAIAGDG